MHTRAHLLKALTDYCEAAGVGEKRFGVLSVNDQRFVSRVRDGGNVTLGTVERAEAYMATNPPAVSRRRLASHS